MLTCQTLTAWGKIKTFKITCQITITIWQQCYHKSVFVVFQFGQANAHSRAKDQMMALPISQLALLKKDKSSILTVVLPLDHFGTMWHSLDYPALKESPFAGMNKIHRCPKTLESLSSTEWMVNRSTQECFLAKRRVKPCFLKWSFLSSAGGFWMNRLD